MRVLSRAYRLRPPPRQYREAVIVAICAALLSGLAVYLLPRPGPPLLRVRALAPPPGDGLVIIDPPEIAVRLPETVSVIPPTSVQIRGPERTVAAHLEPVQRPVRPTTPPPPPVVERPAPRPPRPSEPIVRRVERPAPRRVRPEPDEPIPDRAPLQNWTLPPGLMPTR